MSDKEKLDTLCNYIRTNWNYGSTAHYYYAPDIKTLDCISATGLFGDMAKDLGIPVKYANIQSEDLYDYLAQATSVSGNHVFNAVYLNGQWVGYDAQPQH